MAEQTSKTTKVSDQVVQAAIQSLAKTLATITKQEVQTVLPFAQQWGPQAALWGSNLAAAQQANDQAAVQKYQTDLKLLADDAVLEAVDYGITAQSAGEQTVFALVQFAGQFAAQMALSAIA